MREITGVTTEELSNAELHQKYEGSLLKAKIQGSVLEFRVRQQTWRSPIHTYKMEIEDLQECYPLEQCRHKVFDLTRRDH